jgi:hypothetical protein
MEATVITPELDLSYLVQLQPDNARSNVFVKIPDFALLIRHTSLERDHVVLKA